MKKKRKKRTRDQLDEVVTRIVALAKHLNFDVGDRFTVQITPLVEQSGDCAWSAAVMSLSGRRGSLSLCAGSTATEALLKLEQSLTNAMKQRTARALELLKENT